ncbi:hypothetical protein BAE44_0025091 [Dichanthelium oligosanthes]|uniref:Uncharacterized protein n=1 Tax=Dichanthelium oligosanthes TaxID=888268 RepID=A0A1E5ULX2_9POAL|nr:hypothetical protein BAE44_0025091 [Dichanthelium oligosanthes]
MLSFLLRTPSHLPASCISSLRLLSTAAPTSPKPFAVEDYLVVNCGLTRAQSLKASRYLSHLKSPTKPDAVLAFLDGLGLPRSDIAAVVASDPLILCASVEKTLAPRISELGKLGLSRAQIARLTSVARFSFRSGSLARNLSFWLSVFGNSFETLEKAHRMNSGILTVHIEKVAMPNVSFLQQCGISACEVAGLNMYSSRLLSLRPDSLREAVERVEELGVERGSPMFRHALVVVATMHKEDLARKMELFLKIGFSQDQVLVIVRKAPRVLRLTEEKIRRVMHFLTTDVGLEAPYIAQRPVLFMYSLEWRLLPRHWLLNVLREKELLNVEIDYYYTSSVAEKIFVERFVHPYKDYIPGLADDYASRCSGKAPNRMGKMNFSGLVVQTAEKIRGIVGTAAGSPCNLALLPIYRRRPSAAAATAMLRLRNHLLPLVHAASQLTSPFHHGGWRLLLSTSPAPTPFSLEDYLVAACGLAPAQARSASKKALSEASTASKKAFKEFSTSGLNPRFDPDAVLALLSGVGLSRADIADIVAADPLLLLSRADRLEPRLLALRDRVGLSVPQVSRFLLVGGSRALRRSGDVSLKLEFLVSVYGSFEQLLVVMKRTNNILNVNLDRVIKPNVALLRQCGLTVRDIAQLCSRTAWLLTFNPERVKEFVLRADELGVPRSSGIFKNAVSAVANITKEKVAAKLELLKSTLGCSESEVATAVSKRPNILGIADKYLLRKIQFLVNEVGMEPQYIVERLSLLTYSLEKRLVPRHHVMKVLQEKRLLTSGLSFFSVASLGEETFKLKFIDCHKDSVPGLEDAYATARAGVASLIGTYHFVF